MSEGEITFKILKVPRGSSNIEPMTLDLTDLNFAKSRLKEVAYANRDTAPELVSYFAEMAFEARKMYTQIEFELNTAQKSAKQIRSLILLDKVPERLKAKGLASSTKPTGSEDLREAVIETDPEYSEIQEKIITIKYCSELILSYVEAIKMAYFSVQKIMSQPTPYRDVTSTSSITSGILPNDNDILERHGL